MKSCRKTIGIAAALLSIAVICVTFFQVTSAKASDKLVIRLAHNQAAGSEIADSIALISDIVAEDASMNMEVQIYPSGVLGTEKDIIEMVKAGILDMAKVSSNTLGQFKEEYSIFAVPYLFNGQQHYYDAMQKSEKVKELFMSTEDEGLHSHRLLCQWRQELLSEGRQALCGTVCIKGQEDTFHAQHHLHGYD